MKIDTISKKIWQFSIDQIVINLRFLDMAVNTFELKADEQSDGLAIKSGKLCYQPSFVVKRFSIEPEYIARAHLHMLFHLIFQHPFQYNKRNMRHWDLACDMACENAIISLGLKDFTIKKDEKRRIVLEDYVQKFGIASAARIYRNLENRKFSPDNIEDLEDLFAIDYHRDGWMDSEEMEITLEQIKKLAERAKAELKSFSSDKNGKADVLDNLEEATKERYDYSSFLKKFCVSGEEMKVDPDEFDYIYYTYGLEQYGNIPLIEPLEYKEIQKIKDFVIAIDTSGSTRGKLVQSFINKTYNILKSSENFFSRVNIHILQCDSQVQSDTIVNTEADFEEFMRRGQLQGFGSTDFRPVFKYVDGLVASGELENLKGLIYFTDGFGVFPNQKPDYETAFVFIESEYDAPTTPPWAIKLVLDGNLEEI